MKLKSIEYSQFDGQSEEWRLEKCKLDDINLIVGRNATGKTKTLNIIGALAKLMSIIKKINYGHGNFNIIFDNKGKEMRYILHYKNNKVITERLSIGSKVLLERNSEGKGKIFTEEVQRTLDFQIPEDEVAAMAKRDKRQHPFLEDLFDWGDSLMHFRFGSELGQNQYVIFMKNSDEIERDLDLHDTTKVAGVFRRGREYFKDEFVNLIKKDMALIGYQIDDIGIDTPKSITIKHDLFSEPMGLIVKETDLKCNTDQSSMSQGMFRALSVIIQINYSQMARIPSCILIDDIGEGLDYDRSISLIKLVMEKVKNTHVQLIMATNDRFIMNNVPLQYWSIIQRQGNKSVMINRDNSPKIFDEFQSTGLSNFDFFSSKYYLGTTEEK